MYPERIIGQIQATYQECGSITETARLCKVSRPTVRRYVRLGNRARKEYKRKTQEKVKRRLCRLKLLARERVSCGCRIWPAYGSAEQFKRGLQLRFGENVSRSTVHRNLKALGLKSYSRPTCPTRRLQDEERRAAFARRERHRDWRRIVFSDESWVTCNEQTGRRHWCEDRDEVLPREQRARWNVASVMVWAAFGYNYKSELIVFPAKREDDGEKKPFRMDSKTYVRRCLSTVVPSLVAQNRTFLQDGARSHASRHTNAFAGRPRPFASHYYFIVCYFIQEYSYYYYFFSSQNRG